MRLIPVYLLLIAFIAITFAWWGLQTDSGRSNFDEMDGLIPFFTGAGGIVLMLASFVLIIFQQRKK